MHIVYFSSKFVFMVGMGARKQLCELTKFIYSV